MPDSIYCRSLGKGEKIVLLHGFCESSSIWWKIEDLLSRDFELIMPDIPGFGRSPLPQGGFSIAEISEIMHTWLLNNFPDKVTILGHSLGGYITLSMAKNYPQKFKGVGLLNSTAFEDDDIKKENRLRTIEFIKKHGKEVFLESFVPGLFNKKHSTSQVILEKVRKIAMETSQETMINYTRAMRNRAENTTVLSQNNLPVLFIAGKNDQLIPVKQSLEQIGKVKKGSAHIIDNCGHMCMIEQQEETARYIREFVRSL